MDSKEEQIMFNINIDNPKATNREELSLEAETEVQDFVQNLCKFGTRDYWQYNQETLSGERVNPLQAATIIRDSGITCHDYIVVWHTGYLTARPGLQVKGRYKIVIVDPSVKMELCPEYKAASAKN